jgi:hypothetical protein
VGVIAPTGKRVAIKAVLISRYESELALETRIMFDQAEVLTQLGAMPTLATAAV